MKLSGAGIDICSKGRPLRRLEIGHGYDNVFRFEALPSGSHLKSISVFGQQTYFGIVFNRQLEMVCVKLEIIGDLIFRRKRIAWSGEGQTGKSAVTRRCEEPERVPTISPGVADALIGVKNQKRNTALLQVVAGRKSRLTATDNNGVNVTGILSDIHRFFAR